MIACFLAPQFGISCECRRHPELNNKPLALLNESEILCAVSPEATSFGVHPGQKRSGAAALCEELDIRPYDHPFYYEEAQVLWDMMAIESSVVEPISPEAAFVFIREQAALGICENLVEQLSRVGDCGVQAGLARTRSVARLAAQRAKPGTVNPVASDWERLFLADIPIPEVQEFDRSIRMQMERLGVKTLGDLQKLELRELNRQFPKQGIFLQRFAHGLEFTPVQAAWPPCSLERTMRFDFDMNDLEMLHTAFREKAAEIAGELGISRKYCKALRLEVLFEDGVRRVEQEKLASPMDLPGPLGRAAIRLWQRMEVPSSASENVAEEPSPVVEFRLEAMEISAASGVQLTLLDDNDYGRGLPHERKQRLEAALRLVRKKFGEERLRAGAALRRAKRIGLWTYPLGSRVDEPLIVETGEDGLPKRYWRRGRLREIVSIQNRWKEAVGERGNVAERMVYRVETQPLGFCEIYRAAGEWRLAGVAD